MHYTMKDIARECGVGVMTVSRAFKNDASISPETRKKILDTARKYSYTPNLSARSLKTKGSNIIGWIVPSTKNKFFFQLIPFVQKKLIEKDYSLVLSFISQDTNELSALNDILASRPELVLVHDHSICSLVKDEGISTNTKFICLFQNNAPEDVSKLYIDDIKGTQLATEHLIENGHTRIAFIGSSGRVEGYKAAMAAHGLSHEGLFFDKKNRNVDEVKNFILNTHPSAVISFGSWNTIVYAAITLADLKIPNDISLVMFDDSDIATLLDIDVISHPLDELSDKIVDIIVKTVDSQNSVTLHSEVIDPILIKRRSVKNLNN